MAIAAAENPIRVNTPSSFVARAQQGELKHPEQIDPGKTRLIPAGVKDMFVQVNPDGSQMLLQLHMSPTERMTYHPVDNGPLPTEDEIAALTAGALLTTTAVNRRLTKVAALGALTLLSPSLAACNSAPAPTQTVEVEKVTQSPPVTQASPDVSPASSVTAVPGGFGGKEPILLYPSTYTNADELNNIIKRLNNGEEVNQEDRNKVILAHKADTDATATAEAAKAPAKPEAEKQPECAIFKDPKYCGLVEVFQTTNPKVGNIKGVGIKAPPPPSNPDEPKPVIEIISPMDGWIQPTLDPFRASVSEDKVKVVNGWNIGGVKIKPTGSAEATRIKKGQVIGYLEDTGDRPLEYAPEYMAYFGPRGNEDQLIGESFSGAAAKKLKQFQFKISTPPKILQGPVIVNR